MKNIQKPNIPWQEKPQGYNLPIWRYDQNPIIDRNPVENVARIFNSSVIRFEDRFVGIFRAEQLSGMPFLYFGQSKDGVSWSFEKEPIKVKNPDGTAAVFKYMYDPRLVELDGIYFIVFCTDYHGATMGLIKTVDFKNYIRLENPFLPFNRNGVLFPRKINELYYMLSRPSDSGHTPFGDIFVSASSDLKFWGMHRFVLGKNDLWWQNVKVGSGCNPIETDEGWLLFYHGVTGTCNGFVYSVGGAILDLNNPSKVLYRCKNWLMTPEKDYEEKGFVSNVVFPCSALLDNTTGKIALYYGAADSYVGLAFTTIDEIIRYIKNNAE